MASWRIDTRRTALRLTGHQSGPLARSHQRPSNFGEICSRCAKTAPWRTAGVSALIPKTPIETCTVKGEGHQREPASDGRPRVQIVIAIAETK